MEKQKMFSLYSCPISNTSPLMDITLKKVHELITSERYRLISHRIRVTTDKKMMQKLKSKELDYVTFAGEFYKRSNDSLKKHSGLIVLDFDDLEDIESTREKLINDPQLITTLLFRSPSTKGLKWVVAIDLNKATHQEWFEGISNYLKKTYDLEVDPSGKDVSRACFLCHDPQAYLNPLFLKDDSEITVEVSFTPQDWLESKQLALKKETPIINDENTKPMPHLVADIEKVVTAIEEGQWDITSTYRDWRDNGFALVDGLGEEGRKYFHRISKQYPAYEEEESDRQYDNCLKANGSGNKISIATLFHKAQKAGVDLSNTEQEKHLSPLPTFSKEIYDGLPEFFQQIVTVGKTDTERDILLLGSLATISVCLPNVKGIYDSNYAYPNLYFFLEGKPGAGKAKLGYCRTLVKPIQEHFEEKYKQEDERYRAKMAQYKEEKKNTPSLTPPEKPKQKLLIIPANISEAGLFLLLNNNDGCGLMFETEGDTLADAIKKDFGGFSDTLRKSSHHEPISSFRATNEVGISVEKPKLSVVLSGTPRQITNLIPDAENGLFSRFMYYSIPMNYIWKNVFDNELGVAMDDYFHGLGMKLFKLYSDQQHSTGILFQLTSEQQDNLNMRFERMQRQYAAMQGDYFISVVRRMALIVFRMAMIFTAIRNMEKISKCSSLICNNTDFNNAISVGEVLLEHSKYAFHGLKDMPVMKRMMKDKERFLNALPDDFTCNTYKEVAKQNGINERTAERYISQFCEIELIQHIKQNLYKKVS